MIEGTNGTNETQNYGYPQFVATDKPGWLTDWNKTMEAVDEDIHNREVAHNELAEQVTSDETVIARHQEDIDNLKERTTESENRINDLETTVGDDNSGLVKKVADLQNDLTVDNTITVKNKGAVDSIRDLICNAFNTSVQYEEGAYVYIQDEESGEIQYYKATQRHRGVFNPDHFTDVTEKLITALDNGGGGGGSQYVLPVASTEGDVDEHLGGVIVGDGLTIDPETGVLSATGGGGGGDIPKASTAQYGKVKIDANKGIDVNDGVIKAKIDNDTIVINANGELESTKKITPQDVPDASYNTKGLVSVDSVGGLAVSNGVLSANIDDDYIKRNNQGQLTVNPAKIGGAASLTAGAGIEIDQNTNTITNKAATSSARGGVRPAASEFYMSNTDELHIQLKQDGGLAKDANGLYVVNGGGGGDVDDAINSYLYGLTGFCCKGSAVAEYNRAGESEFDYFVGDYVYYDFTDAGTRHVHVYRVDQSFRNTEARLHADYPDTYSFLDAKCTYMFDALTKLTDDPNVALATDFRNVTMKADCASPRLNLIDRHQPGKEFSVEYLQQHGPNVSANEIDPDYSYEITGNMPVSFNIPASCKNQPMLALFPYRLEIRSDQSVTYPLVNQTFDHHLAVITYRVYEDRTGAVLGEKVLRVPGSMFSNKVKTNEIDIKECVYSEDAQGYDTKYIYGAIMLPATEAEDPLGYIPAVRFSVMLEMIDLTTGTIRYHSDGMSSIRPKGYFQLYNIGHITKAIYETPNNG